MRLNPVHISLLIIPFVASPAMAHDWYSGLQTPSGVSCCNDGDCQRVGHRYSAETGHEVEIEDQWVRVDPGLSSPCRRPTA